MASPAETVEAWIDVGGTFTDCYVSSPSLPLRRTKVLSSGRLPISGTLDSTRLYVSSPALTDDVDGFWTGASLRIYSLAGSEIASRQVAGFAQATLELDQPLSDSSKASMLAEHAIAGWRFELDAKLEAPVLGVRRLLQVPLGVELPPLRIRIGTTRGTNALLTRRGARTALAVTAPFTDLLEIGDQTRPQLFALAVRKPAPLTERTIGIRERLDAAGQVVEPLDSTAALKQLKELRGEGFDSLAICLLHSYLNPEHEIRLERLAQQAGFEQISRSSQLAPLIELVARAQTTSVDAYLSPIIRSYLSHLVDQFGTADSVHMHVMTSAGGLVDWQLYSGKDSILSGPAGGVAALQSIAGSVGELELIGLDMGGTSTDVSRVSDEHNLEYESTKAGVRILTPTLPIETVASGGGSICWFDGVSLRVGPQSAGAHPGPACYGRGGPLTVTDLNVFLGRIPAGQFPFPLELEALEVRLDRLLAECAQPLALTTREALAEGFRRIANEQMAAAVRTVSISHGADPRTHGLLGFGGAAGQHVCDIAGILEMRTVLDAADAGLLSALGMGLADQRLDAARPVYCMARGIDWKSLASEAERLAKHLTSQLQSQGVDSTRSHCHGWLEIRYVGTDQGLTIAWPPPWEQAQQLAEQFADAHRVRFGYSRSEHPLEVVSLRIEVVGRSPQQLPQEVAEKGSSHCAIPAGNSRMWVEQQWRTVPTYRRDELLPGQFLTGPCIVLNAGSTLVVDSGWKARVLSGGTLRLSHATSNPVKTSGVQSGAKQPATFSYDPVFRDCFSQRLSAIATQMGVVLQQTAVSVNVKQRRDFSCAVFDAGGQLLANAPHVPVHLGAMGKTVREIIEGFPDITAGDTFITNDPYRGGSHLPDVTLVAPVFPAGGGCPAFYVANRAHHADIGGIAPGSMSVNATRLGEEGVVIVPMKLTEASEDRTERLRSLLQAHPYPPRNVAENLADITAQQAAIARGAALLDEYARTVGWDVMQAYSETLLDAAQQRFAQFIRQRFTGTYEYEDCLDDGTVIRVRISKPREDRLHIDFTGSGPTSPSNFNANPSIVTAAVMYVMRCLIADETPLNEGVMRCLELVVPSGVLNPSAASTASESPAVAAGNVETSQRVVDVLLGAFGVAAASQGTMNNLLFGNQQFGFYETICGGAGAVEGCAGASGVHTHMTNTRLTDPELLESRYPVRLVDFRLRHGSGGEGKWAGGEGVIRVLEFLEPVELSLLTSRRGTQRPFGLQGGQPGANGQNTLIRGGARTTLPACCHLQLAAGDQLEIKTPGGGGFGPPPSE